MQQWQNFIPQHGLSRLMGALARWRCSPLKNWALKKYIEYYRVNMHEALEEDFRNYANFNEFFTRALKPELRPIDSDPNSIISPVDGHISQLGKIKTEQLLQAKGRDFSLADLLGSANVAEQFVNGSFFTAYLSPADYHRIHMPIAGRLQQMLHIPGKLFSVNRQSVKNIPNLFSRNERVVSLFDTEIGAMALVAVGAMVVGGISTVWQGLITPPSKKAIHAWDYSKQNIYLQRGEQMGHFELGSTIILCFGSKKIDWLQTLTAESPIKLGMKIADRQ